MAEEEQVQEDNRSLADKALEQLAAAEEAAESTTEVNAEDYTAPETPPETPPEPVAAEPEAPSEEPPAPEEPPVEGTDQPGLFDIADSLGVGQSLREKYQDETAALHGLVHGYQAIGKRDEDAQYGREFREYQSDFQKWLQERDTPAPADPDPADDYRYNPPEFDDRWSPYLSTTPTGLVVPNPKTAEEIPGGVPQDVIRAAQAKIDYEERYQTKTKDLNPAEIEERVLQRVQEENWQKERQAISKEIINRRIEQDWMFQRDTNGNFVTSPVDGGWVPSQMGQVYVNACDTLARDGITDPYKIDEYAYAAAVAAQTQMRAQQQPPQQQAPQAPAPQQQTPVQPPAPPATPPGGYHTQNVANGTAPTPQQSPNLYSSLMQANKAAAARGETVYTP